MHPIYTTTPRQTVTEEFAPCGNCGGTGQILDTTGRYTSSQSMCPVCHGDGQRLVKRTVVTEGVRPPYDHSPYDLGWPR